jgi:hypothetical protein
VRRSLTVRPVALQGRVEEVRYKKRDDGLRYRHDSDGDLWLVETGDGRRGTLTLPRAGDGWTRDGDTTWLTNPPMKKRSSSARRRSSTTRRKAKRSPPKGFRSWSTYMASIRPNRARSSASKGGSMAARKKRRRRYTRRASTRRRRRSVTVASNPPRRRRARRRYTRRNPPAFSVGGVINNVMDVGKGALCVLGGEAGTRWIRSDLLGMDDGETLSSITDFAIGTGLGLLTQRFLGRQAARDLAVGAYAYVGRTIARQLGSDKVTELLGDGGPPMHRFELRDGRLVRVPLASYPRQLAGYPSAAQVNGYDEDED